MSFWRTSDEYAAENVFLGAKGGALVAPSGELRNSRSWLDRRQGRYCFGKTPMQTFLDARTIAQEKQVGEQFTAQLEA